MPAPVVNVMEQTTTRPDADTRHHVLHTWRRYRHDELIKHIPYQRGLRVLDVSCGRGSLLQSLIENTGSPWGVDRSWPALTWTPKPRRVAAAGSEHLPFAGGTFDVVLSRHLLHRPASAEAELCELRRVMRPEGRLISLESARMVRAGGGQQLARMLCAANLTLVHREPLGYLANPTARLLARLPGVQTTRFARVLVQGMFALDSVLARVPAFQNWSWHIIFVAENRHADDQNARSIDYPSRLRRGREPGSAPPGAHSGAGLDRAQLRDPCRGRRQP